MRSEGNKIQTKWTNDEWTIGEADMLAGQARENEFNQVRNYATAPRFRQAGGIQVITPEGSIAGRIPKRLLELITT